MNSSAWPALDYEARSWTPIGEFGVRATADRVGGRTYQAALPPFIATLSPQPDSVAKEAAEEAASELTRFDAELGSRVAAFAPVLLRSEAASSSQIENLTASARAIFTADLGAKSGQNAMLIAANTRAMQSAIDLSDDLSAAAITRMHEVLMQGQQRHTPGMWRTEPVWIGTRADSPLDAEFVAPHEDRVPALIDDLVAFSRRWDVQSLTLTAVAHAQFETIHPFSDGNGRTGRAFAQALLRHRKVTQNVAVPVSAGLLANVDGYHDALTAYREGDVSPIVRSFAEASLRAIANSRQLIADLDEIRSGWSSTVTARRNSNVWPLLDVLLRRPVIDAATAALELGVQAPNVYPPLRTLVEQGILKSKAEHKAGPYWRSDDVLAAIDRFAERAGRRVVDPPR